MTKNRLKMNADKTECILFGKNSQGKKFSNTSINVGNSEIDFQNKIDFLGVPLDGCLTMKNFITKKCKSISLHLHNIRRIRKHLSQRNAEIITLSLVTSQLDYANALLNNLPANSIHPLQRLQNQAAKLVLLKQWDDSSTESLKTLHWLPVKFRIIFKILCLAFKAIHKQSPTYLQNMFQIKQQSRYNLRSNQQIMYNIPHSNCVTLGDRSFAVSAPKMWNSLPQNLRECTNFKLFKKKLKTHLFSQAFI